ncbi:neuferricin homolog [Musca autumnalis]|uniref:neuferricin homolog n=1 Tax=Musca autumnalis TaxID=221902 RepID=UPI003CE6C051
MLRFLKPIFKLQFLVIILGIVAGIYYPQIIEKLQSTFLGQSVDVSFESAQQQQQYQEKLFTKEELAQFNGENDGPLYLALLGRVYNVTRGAKHYGSGCEYNFFVGRDASVSFITGEFDNFEEDKADDVLSLKPADLLGLHNWQKFYEKDYEYKGKLIGRFYDEQGQLTKYHHKYLALLEQAQDEKTANEKLREIYPDCNIEWSADKGSHVWCTKSSGGKNRNWIGYPRKLFEIGNTKFRCACVRKEDLDTTQVMLAQYDDCEPFSHECYYHVD